MGLAAASILLATLSASPAEAGSEEGRRELAVPILGVKSGYHPTGTVAYLRLAFEKQATPTGLIVHFKDEPGKFSRLAQTSVEQAILRTARSLALPTDSWRIELSVPYPGVTIYGESLSAMIALCVAALANGDVVEPGRAITGTVTADGHIGPVGSIPLKIAAAQDARLHRVLVPEEKDPGDDDYAVPFLMQVTPVSSVRQAYTALTSSPRIQ
jgi:ATP-dependent Lon protease